MSGAAPVRVRTRRSADPKLAEDIQRVGSHGSRRQMELHVPEAKMRVKRTVYGQELEREEEIEVPAFHGPVAYVRVAGSVTKNLGDYNSARVEVSVSLPCYPKPEEINQTYRAASLMVDEFVSRELDIATGVKNPEEE